MQFISTLDWLFTTVNNVLNVVLPLVGLLGLIGYVVYYLVNSIRKYQKKKDEGKGAPKKEDASSILQRKKEEKDDVGDIFSQTLILLLLVAGIVAVFWVLPQLTLKWPGWKWLPTFLRWIEFALVVILGAYVFGHEKGGRRWLISSIGHVGAIFLGWAVDRWLGVIFITLPFMLAYYFSLYHLAAITLPATNPDDKSEKLKRFYILAFYTWGIQLPIMVVGDHAWQKPDVRIPGEITYKLPPPGMVWVKSHQVVGVSSGTQFRRVDGPGVVYLGYLERPWQVVDLRLQLRSSEIDVVSQDGIKFKVRVFTAFRMDPEKWDKDTYDKLRPMNPLLRAADKPTHTIGSFPFSPNRVQAALGITGSLAASPEMIIPWDRWALNVIEDAARKVVAQKTLDELWRPKNDKKFADALDIIAEEIKESVFLTLRSAGILAFATRIVNFRFPTEDGQSDGIVMQQIASWGSEWQRKRSQILAKAEAEAERTQQEARAYAESMLLNSIAEGLQKTQEIHPRLPRYVIAMRFLSALQDYIHKTPEEGEDNSEGRRIADLRTSLGMFQNQISTSANKGKPS